MERAEPPKIMYDTPHTKPVQVAPSTISSKARLSTVPPDIAKKMEIFQVIIRNENCFLYSVKEFEDRNQCFYFKAKNNLPVHIKGGPADKVLLGVTVALIGVGLVSSAKLIYDLACPKK